MHSSRLLLLLLCALALMAGVVADVAPLREETFSLGPFTINGQHALQKSGLLVPRPEGTVGIQYWGDWEIIDDTTGETVPHTTVFLHHALFYEGSMFVAGTSDERNPWGPNFVGSYVYKPHARITGSFHLNNLRDEPLTVRLRWTVKYWRDDEIPADAIPLRCKFLAINYQVPGGGEIGSTHLRNRSWVLDAKENRTIVEAQGHLHQGGINIKLINEQTREIYCSSDAWYNPEVECFRECASCPSDQVRQSFMQGKAFWRMSECTRIERGTVLRGERLLVVATYDNSCAWPSVMSWFFVWYH